MLEAAVQSFDTHIPPEVKYIAVTPEETTIKQGGSQELVAVVVTVGGAEAEVTWSVKSESGEPHDGLVAIDPAKVLVSVSENGVYEHRATLEVDVYAPVGKYEVSASTVFEGNTIKECATITVVDFNPIVSSVSLNIVSATVRRGGTLALNATVEGRTDKTGLIEWTVSGSSSTVVVNPEDSSFGTVLTEGANEPNSILRVKAVSVDDPAVSASAVIVIPTVNSVAVVPGTVEVIIPDDDILSGKTSYQFAAAINGVYLSSSTNDGINDKGIVWSLAGTSLGSDTQIDSTGKLTVGISDASKQLTVKVKTADNNTAVIDKNNALEGTATVRLKAIDAYITRVDVYNTAGAITMNDAENTTGTTNKLRLFIDKPIHLQKDNVKITGATVNAVQSLASNVYNTYDVTITPASTGVQNVEVTIEKAGYSFTGKGIKISK
jgi:hypothetical protein